MRFLGVFALIHPFFWFCSIVFAVRRALPRNNVPPVLTALKEAKNLLERDETIYIPNFGDYWANLAMCAHS